MRSTKRSIFCTRSSRLMRSRRYASALAQPKTRACMPRPEDGWPDAALCTVVRNGVVYAPRYLGPRSVVVVGDTIAWVGPDDMLSTEVRGLGSWAREIDARGCLLLPGLIDPHEHTIGAGGEQGYASRTGEVTA